MKVIPSFTHAGQTFINATPEQIVLAGVPAAVVNAFMLKSYAADKRWRVETGGIVVNGLALPTDDRAKMLLMGAGSWLAANDTTTVCIGTAKHTMSGTQIKALRDAIYDHVDRCFVAQGDVYDAIDAGTITTTAQIDAFAWPSNT